MAVAEHRIVDQLAFYIILILSTCGVVWFMLVANGSRLSWWVVMLADKYENMFWAVRGHRPPAGGVFAMPLAGILG